MVSLVEQICSLGNLEAAFNEVEQNKGGPGIDAETIDEFRFFLEGNLEDLNEELRDGSYRPQPVKRTYIPKPGAREPRPLGIPTVRDRVVQAAVLLVLEPLFERLFADNSYGFRPNRSAKNALRQTESLIKAGHRFVVEADIVKYFDSIPHEQLLNLVKAVVDDETVIRLIRALLKAGVMEDGTLLSTPELGTPQGGVISPLLANIYLNPLDHLMRDQGYSLVRYADDFVIPCLTHDEAQAAFAEVEEWMHSVSLNLHPEKTRIVDITKHGGFDFLGYHLEQNRHWPRKKSVQKLMDTVLEKTRRHRPGDLEEIIQEVNVVLMGWFAYFKHSTEPFLELDSWVASKLRSLMRSRNRVGKNRALHRWSDASLHDQGLFSLAVEHTKVIREWK